LTFLPQRFILEKRLSTQWPAFPMTTPIKTRITPPSNGVVIGMIIPEARP
jgi:hypothetical protein